MAEMGRHGDEGVLIDPRLDHHVHLDGRKPGFEGMVDAAQDLFWANGAAGHGGHRGCIQGIETDGETLQADLAQCLGQVAGKHCAVGGHGQIIDAGYGRQHGHQLGDTPAQQGLAPCEAQLGDSQLGSCTGHPGDLLEGQHVPARQESIAGPKHFAWHAVGAAQVAAVGERQAQIGQRPPQSVDGMLGHGGMVSSAVAAACRAAGVLMLVSMPGGSHSTSQSNPFRARQGERSPARKACTRWGWQRGP